jgi:hypothetical protein
MDVSAMSQQSPSPALEPWTVERARAVLEQAADHLREIDRTLQDVLLSLPPPPDIDDRQEHRKPYDVATEILATIECVGDELRHAVDALLRAARISDAELVQEHQEWDEQWSRIRTIPEAWPRAVGGQGPGPS